MRVRINPKLWSVSEFAADQYMITHDPVEVPDKVGKALLELRRKGVALVVEADPEEPTQERLLLQALALVASDDEDFEDYVTEDYEEMIPDGS